MILQKDVFYEDEIGDTHSVIKKYFPDTKIISDEDIMFGNIPRDYRGAFRGSLFLATRLGLGKRFAFCNAIEWAPALRQYMISKDFFFQDACHLVQSFDETRHMIDGELFVRPTSGNKVFSGNVFNKTTFTQEFNFFTRNKNESPYTMCLVAAPQKIKTEWRVIFAGGEYCGASQYMVYGERSVDSVVPTEVVDFAITISKDNYFQNIFDFVIDVGEIVGTVDGEKGQTGNVRNLGLVEINGFETASFYAADLERVYSTWSKSLLS